MNHFCIFEINMETKSHKFFDDFGEDYEAANDCCQSMNNFRSPDMPVYYCMRCLDPDEFDNIDTYSPFIESVFISVR